MDSFDRVAKKADDERLAIAINEEMDRNRPKREDFVGIYSDEELDRDSKRVMGYLSRRGIDKAKDRKALRDGILVEKMFLDSELKDLLCEAEIYDELLTDDEDFLLFVMPSYGYDDVFNNVDLICVVRNELTNHKVVPFAIDCTSNSSMVEKKMGYRRTDEKIAGFTDVKYFKDTTSFTGVMPAGRLAKVPRFVVGFDAQLARDTLTSDRNEWTRDEMEKKSDMTKYYLLKELAIQSKGGELEGYFNALLFHFEKTRGDKILSYPDDDVLEEILKFKSGEVVNG